MLTRWIAASAAALLTAGVPGVALASGSPSTPLLAQAQPAPSQPASPANPRMKFPVPINRPAPQPQKGGVTVGKPTPPGGTVAPPGQVASPAQQLSQARHMATLFNQATGALQGLQQAEQSLSAQATGAAATTQRAQVAQQLTQAINALRQIRQSAPYNDLQQRLYQTSTQLQSNQKLGATAIQPLQAAVDQNKIYLAPQVVSNVREANNALEQGDEYRAALDLKTASTKVYNDVALGPIDQALTDLTAAQQALAKNDTRTAAAKVKDARQLTHTLSLDGPLVPVRFELRAAANASAQKQHHQAQTLVQDAGDQLRGLRTSITDPKLRGQLDPLITKVANLRKELDAGKTPSESTLQSVAQQATAFTFNQAPAK